MSYKSKKKWLPIGLIFFSLIINLAFYSRLPANIAIHQGVSGTDGFLPKYLYIIFITLVSVAIYLFYKVVKRASENKNLFVAAVLFLVNIILLVLNIK
ncbi:DUF1648 domain-containing protein [Clostridium felsineum]|uniref:DUF1648 domain-containing protein n=1 Tax=Clostridium felsineum TaxID=36839 RepID=A0A1S8LIJ2_9CLOT|nr:DUF1648 domain-containing protein [Clostridium felsineum]URZ09325.1 hypothetical protein CLROS_047410 [Clostridium felsineum]URZ14011.1 hypothetical protein CROST_047890 [Clostridium felsineum]